MDLGLQGRHAVVTGASKGIGLACAKALVAEGCTVTLVSRHAGRLAEAQQQVGSQSQVFAADLSKAAAR
ncbi:MAG: SDR family NAD(P)-dependent oxidoreductase, partial [Hyphomicrobiales bacterium]|nr:SDR family NAD(P)-dependent oxidoreductase [Hyphomicrobiales bacterium]